MKFTTPIATTLCAFFIAGCAGMTPPNAQDMAQVPIVRYGDTAPAGKAFATYYPAGTALPVSAYVDGTLFAQSDAATLHVMLNRDVYVYRQWASFDGKTWQRGNDLVTGKFEMQIPGTLDGKNPGKLHASFDLK